MWTRIGRSAGQFVLLAVVFSLFPSSSASTLIYIFNDQYVVVATDRLYEGKANGRWSSGPKKQWVIENKKRNRLSSVQIVTLHDDVVFGVPKGVKNRKGKTRDLRAVLSAAIEPTFRTMKTFDADTLSKLNKAPGAWPAAAIPDLVEAVLTPMPKGTTTRLHIIEIDSYVNPPTYTTITFEGTGNAPDVDTESKPMQSGPTLAAFGVHRTAHQAIDMWGATTTMRRVFYGMDPALLRGEVTQEVVDAALQRRSHCLKPNPPCTQEEIAQAQALDQQRIDPYLFPPACPVSSLSAQSDSLEALHQSTLTVEQLEEDSASLVASMLMELQLVWMTLPTASEVHKMLDRKESIGPQSDLGFDLTVAYRKNGALILDRKLCKPGKHPVGSCPKNP